PSPNGSARGDGRQPAVASIEALRATVTQLLGGEQEDIGDHDDLFGHGIDSIRIMRLAAAWRHAGVRVTFSELAEQPTIAAWWELVSGRAPDQGPPAPPPAADDGEPFALAPMQQAYWVGRASDQVLGGVS